MEIAWGRQLSEADEAARAQELIEEDAAEICSACRGEGFAPCPDLEFDGHREEGCRYDCYAGEIVCCCKEADA